VKEFLKLANIWWSYDENLLAYCFLTTLHNDFQFLFNRITYLQLIQLGGVPNCEAVGIAAVGLGI